MNRIPYKKDLLSLGVLLCLIAVLAFIYIKPESISKSFSDATINIDSIIYSDNYDLQLTTEEKNWLKDNPNISVGIDQNTPPFGSISARGEYSGLTADVLKTIEHRLSISFDIEKNIGLKNTMEMVRSGGLDIVAASIDTKQWKEYVNSTKPYVTKPTVIINDAFNKGYIGSLENLNGKKVTIEEGSFIYNKLQDEYPEIDLMPTENTQLALELVATNIADAYVGNAISASFLIKKFGHQNLSFSGETQYLSNHRIAVQKNNSILFGILDKTLESISLKDLRAMTNHWSNMRVEQNINSNTIIKVIVALLALLLMLLAWSLTLRKSKNELKASQRLTQLEAERDHLTGLGNRRKFFQLLQKRMQEANKTKTPFAILQLDLDRFKEINDNFGHAVGDLLIVEVAKRLSDCLSATDFVTRLSGDEFMIILSGYKNKDEVEECAKRIRTSLSHVYFLQENEIYTSASMGITSYPCDAKNSKELFNNVDQAMFHSKKTGKDRYTFFTQSMKNDIILRNNTIKDLRTAIKEEQFELVYQPIIDLGSNKVSKAEALIRWNHPTRGLVPPDLFIPLAEETGLIIDIGEWVFKTAVAETVKIKKALNSEFQMSINTSPLQYGKKGIKISNWFSHIITSGLSGNNIALELTESVLMESSDSIRNKLYNLRDLDVKISIDDFGTGYSSLSYLQKFDIDYLKIDRSFIQNLSSGRESDDVVLVQAIIIMAHKLGCKVIAEGIEDETQRAILAKEGCDFGQGYHFSKPLSSKQFLSFLENWEESDPTNDHIIPFEKSHTNEVSKNRAV